MVTRGGGVRGGGSGNHVLNEQANKETQTSSAG